MRKKTIALAIIAINAILAIIPQSHAADTGGILNRQAAIAQVQEHSTDLWNLRENIRFMNKEWKDQLASAKSIDTEKMKFHNPFTDEEDTYIYENPVQMQLRLAKEYYPEVMHFEAEKLEKTLEVVENQFANAADNMYSGLYGTYQNLLLSRKSLDQARKVLTREETRYKNGLITALDMDSAKLEVEAQENAVLKAERDFDNLHRQFNQMAGLKLDFRYDMIGTPFVATNRITISEDQAVADALKNRKEIWEINRQKQMVNMRLGIYQHKNVHLTDMQTREDYTDALTELEDLELQLSEQKRAIEKEIRKAWQDLQICYLDLEITKLELVKLKNQLETVENQYRAGLIPVSYVEQLQDGINQLETAVNMNMITTLIKKDQFSRAISIGPGY